MPAVATKQTQQPNDYKVKDISLAAWGAEGGYFGGGGDAGVDGAVGAR